MQITLLNGFTLGKFVSFTHKGCQDAYLEFSEQSRTPIGGAFCGQSWGPSVFYSETRSLVITIKLFKLLRDQSGYNFDFRIDYKFLPKDESVVRFGGLIKSENHENLTRDHHHMLDNKSNNRKNKFETFPSDHADDFMYMKSNWYENTLNLTSASSPSSSSSPPASSSIYTERLKNQMRKFNKQQRQQQHSKNLFPSDVKYYLGDLIPGTYCSRIFSDCNKKPCRLQSPNYPGLYPRNLTCYFAVRQVSGFDRKLEN